MLLLKKIAPLSVYHQNKLNITGYVGIGVIKFHSQWSNQDSLIDALHNIEEEGIQIQIFNCTNIISPQHLYYAVYFAEQAFLLTSNISNNKSIEYLIYASFQRQIKNAIKTVGYTNFDDDIHQLAYIVITASDKPKISATYKKVLSVLNVSSLEQTSLVYSSKRTVYLKEHFQITDFELKNAISCVTEESVPKSEDQNTSVERRALLYIATERMAQLLMENFKSN